MAIVDVPIRKSVALLIEHGGELRRFCNLSWSQRDASLYVHPQSERRIAYAGVHHGVNSDRPWTVDFAAQLSAKGTNPYVALHQSGQVHAHCGLNRTAAVAGPPLAEGDHVASVICADIASLPLCHRSARGVPNPDFILRQGDEFLGTVVAALFTSTSRDSLPDSRKFTISMRRPTLALLEVGVTVRGEDVTVTGDDPSGVVVIAGWGAGRRDDQPHDLVYAVAR